MSETLWNLPVPATALLRGPVFTELEKRRCELSYLIEAKDNNHVRAGLVFEDVEAFKCTFLHACSAEMFDAAYGKLVRLGTTPWLNEVQAHVKASFGPKELQHLMICFDDGPCYEFVCVDFRPF